MGWFVKSAAGKPCWHVGMLGVAALSVSTSLAQAQDDSQNPSKSKAETAANAGATTGQSESQTDAASTEDKQRQREMKFAEYMSGASLKGKFTIQGMADKMPEETYTISKCEKLPEGNLYRFTARIQYGDTDTELPMDIPVEWAGDTPVISLTNMWIPGLGTFSARVLIYKDTYAGTWMHDDVGGQMFGVIVREKAEAGQTLQVQQGTEKAADSPKSEGAAPGRID